jgi:hypothetical protein
MQKDKDLNLKRNSFHLLTFKIVSLFSIVTIPFSASAQKYVSDSLVVKFGSDDMPRYSISVPSVTDTRILKPNCIAITDRIRYYNVPVDYMIVLPHPLSVEIKNMFRVPDSYSGKDQLSLEIKEFTIKQNPGYFKNNYKCNAIISVSNSYNNEEKYLGSLVYEYSNAFKKVKKQPGKEYELFLSTWKYKFAADMLTVAANTTSDSISPPLNFVKIKSDFRKNMIISADFAAWTDSWLADCEIMFSRPEPQKEFRRTGSILRYRHDKKYESIEFSISNQQYNRRITDKFVLLLKSKLFWGLNYWNDNEFKKHGLEDLFLADFSASQSILYNPFYKKGIIFGTGIMEDLTYIYTENIKFRPYLMLQIGIKL